MNETYILRHALTLNATGKKYNAVASPVTLAEIRKHACYFDFDFSKLKIDGNTVYKLCRTGDENVWQGLVAFKKTPGALNCANMETSIFNKHAPALYSGVGKCIIALCCKYSFDNGMEGFIYFDAKNRLMPYYARFGAKRSWGLRMVIEEDAAKKLIDNYF